MPLLTHSARPVRQRESRPLAEGFGIRLCSSSLVGVWVIARSRSRVRWSTSPVTGICRLAWNPLTLAAVAVPYVPVTDAENQPICLSRACRSRTRSPLDPCFMIAGPATSLLCSSALVGSRVRLTSAAQVARSTSPLRAISRFAWKPLTPRTVRLP